MLTEEQRAKLHAAIDKAQGHSTSRYTRGGQPCCVIAQLAVAEGVSLKSLRAWDRRVAPGVMGLVHPSQYALSRDGAAPEAEKIRGYPPPLLRDLQVEWDSLVHDAEAARAVMHARVEEAYETVPIAA